MNGYQLLNALGKREICFYRMRMNKHKICHVTYTKHKEHVFWDF